MISKKFFLILGCQRSGTTLMRLILNSHKEIHCFDEYKAYDLLNNNTLLSDFLKDSKKSLIGFKTPVYTEQMNEKNLVDWLQLREIQNIFSTTKIIFIYRDPRDVCVSLKNHISTHPDGDYLVPVFKFWKTQMPEIYSEFKNDFNKIENQKNNLLQRAALFWKIKNHYYFNYKEKNKKILGIKYEELCMNPKNEIKKITDFLDLSWDDSMLFHNKIEHDEVKSNGLTVGNNNASLPIRENSIGLYKQILNPIEEKSIISITKDLMKLFNYKTNS
jgi:hypothetical protein